VAVRDDGGGPGPATVQHHYVALRKALKFAQHDRLLVHNPCDGVRLPKNHSADQFEPVFLPAVQVETLAAELDATDPYGLLIRFVAYTGLRAAEVTGLRVGDLNLKAGHVEVRQTMQRLSGQWVAATPKSKRSTRNVPIVNRALAADLRSYLLRHPKSGDASALLLPGRQPGTATVDWERVFDVASFRRNYMRPALRRLGMKEMRFHDLRHTFASMMLDAGYEPRKASHWMGHANLTTDTIFGHLYPVD
jgi:integrase